LDGVLKPSVEIAKAIMLTHLGSVTAVPPYSDVAAAEIAMALCGMSAAAFRTNDDPEQAVCEARMMIDAPVAIAVVVAMLDGGEDVLEAASEVCSENGNDRRILVESIALARVATVFCDVDYMIEALERLP
jgi:hypothetical protein